MISFRFHLVSIVAVFLALAVGIVVGSTVIDRAIVNGLRSRVDEVSANLDERQAANDELNAEVDQLSGWITEAGPFSVTNRLRGTHTVVVVDRGVDQGPVDRAIELLESAGSVVRGQLTVDDSWLLEDDELAAGVAEAVGLDPDDPVEDVQAAAADALVTELAGPAPSTDADPDEGEPTDLAELTALDVVDYEAFDDSDPARAARVQVLVVTGPESDLGGPAHTEHFAVAAAESTGGVVVAEVWAELEDGPDRADSLAPILGSPTLYAEVATVDDLDLVQGPATTVLTLAAARAGAVGHYGVGDGAEAAAPPPPNAS